jgi:hypothetical protein
VKVEVAESNQSEPSVEIGIACTWTEHSEAVMEQIRSEERAMEFNHID